MQENDDNTLESWKKIGKRFHDARKAKKLNIDEVVESTNIRAAYIKAMEEGNLGVLPGGFYIKGYLRTYAEFLGLDSAEILVELENRPEEEKEEKKNKNKPAATKSEQKPALILVLITVIIASLIYIFWVGYNQKPIIKDKNAEHVISALTKKEYTVNVLAKEKVKLTVLDSQGVILNEMDLNEGDTYFFPDYKGIMVKADKIEAIEFYIDGDSVSAVDNLEKKDGALILDINKMLAKTEISKP